MRAPVRFFGMSRRKQALLFSLAAAGVVMVLSGLVLEGCILLSVAIEVYVLCSAYVAPMASDPDPPDEDDEGPGGWEPPDFPPDPWPPSDPAVREADERVPALV